ncbi:serine/threonine-protein kinase [Panicum miliaceum]|uniref:Serine/threonine-protein kinase n=1 Tax=Panicum miliaceum TaxID=4540 RepID=A0A3L6QGJ0_PANMI|nr:serine/threonine-protein kinase [Panicum miliaceum]
MVAYHCLHSVPKSRPTMRDVVDALEPLLAMCADVPAGPFVYTVPADDGKADEAAAGAATPAVHAESELPAGNQRYASSVAGSKSPSPKQSRDRGA